VEAWIGRPRLGEMLDISENISNHDRVILKTWLVRFIVCSPPICNVKTQRLYLVCYQGFSLYKGESLDSRILYLCGVERGVKFLAYMLESIG